MSTRYTTVSDLPNWTVHDSKTKTDLFPTIGTNRSYCYHGTPEQIAQRVSSALNGMNNLKKILAAYDEKLLVILQSKDADIVKKQQLRIDALLEFRDSVAKTYEAHNDCI